MRHCPLCAKETKRRVRYTKGGYDISECFECELLYRDVLPSSEELEVIYSSGYFIHDPSSSQFDGYRDYIEDEDFIKINFKKKLSCIEGATPSRGSLLDVGCAAGFFVEEAIERGWNAYGIDVSREMTSFGQRTLGYRIVRGPFSEEKLSMQSFDVITMWDYLEHSLDPIGDLALANRLLSERGILALTTCDTSSLCARLSGSRWHLLTPKVHMTYFNRKTLCQALAQEGFTVISFRYLTWHYSLAYLFHKLTFMLPVPHLQFLTSHLSQSVVGQMVLPCNLFDIFIVLAQKEKPVENNQK